MKTIHHFRRAPRIIAALAAATVAMIAAGCAMLPGRAPLACDDALKSAFAADPQVRVVAVRAYRGGERITAVDSSTPIVLAGDTCLVNLLVGPGVTAEPKDAPSYTEGIGIEVWLPSPDRWNERIRDYGGGGWVGGGHRTVDKIGSKVPVLVNANMGYVSSSTDAGQPDYQSGSFILRANGTLNHAALRDFSYRSLVEQATKTRALTRTYYGRDARYAYFDGHSQGGRQALKLAQDYPELYDGFLVAAPAISQEKFSLSRIYTQLVLRDELGFTAADTDRARAFAAKMVAVNARAVTQCDREKLGFLIDPAACAYDPLADPAMLCNGVRGRGVTGASINMPTCLSESEATAINRIWYGPTTDGSVETNPVADVRTGNALGARQLWWNMHRGADFTSQITAVNTDVLVLLMQDASWASSLPSSYTSATARFVNGSTAVRDRWKQLTIPQLADLYTCATSMQPAIGHLYSEDPDLSKLRSLGRKVIVHHGLGEDVIPSQGVINYYTRVSAAMGGDAEVNRFLRLYLTPANAHSSQGRAYTIGNAKNDMVPIPKLPGNNNQTPTREQDQMFTALVDWVERDVAPEDIVIASRDASVSYPVCVHPKKITWDGTGSSKLASSYSCR